MMGVNQNWPRLSEFPALVKYAKVEGIYKSFSTLLMLSIPVAIWDMLPDHPACAFVGYTTSPNLLNWHLEPLEEVTKSTEVVAEKQPPLEQRDDHLSERKHRIMIPSIDTAEGSEGSPEWRVDLTSLNSFSEDELVSST